MTGIRIKNAFALSAVGSEPKEYINSLESGVCHFSEYNLKSEKLAVCKISDKYSFEQELDRTVQLAVFCALNIVRENIQLNCGINIGSSRGATQTFESSYGMLLSEGIVSSLTSPLSTLGNISSQIARLLGLEGLAFSHSVTCSTGMHAILNAIAWIKSGLSTQMLVGASEAALTDFTIAQMKALRIYGKFNENYPCQPFSERNTFMLGEGCSLFLLESGTEGIEIAGFGYAQEQIPSYTGVTAEGEGFVKSMQMALSSAKLEDVDLVFAHAPGTKKGDAAELFAINKVFKNNPYIYSNKFRIGHCFAASGTLSIYEAMLCLENQILPKIPYEISFKQNIPKAVNSILINAAGFGGNIVSIILKR